MQLGGHEKCSREISICFGDHIGQEGDKDWFEGSLGCSIFGDLAPEERREMIIQDSSMWLFCLMHGADQDFFAENWTGSLNGWCLSARGDMLNGYTRS
jgi:hypothetical protein